MKKTRKVRLGLQVFAGGITLALMLTLGLFFEGFSIVSHAESQAKVTAGSANIRKEPNASSTVLGSTEKDKIISIKSQTTGSDGAVWYQVFVDANTLGYIRSDLVSITDGSTPPTENPPASTGTEMTTPPPAASETPVEVTAVQPISANATGSQSIRVRANASTTSQIVTTVKEGLALTVTGQAAGTDGNVWYQVTFIDNGAEVTGFIRNDYVALSGELMPIVDTPPGDEGAQQPSEPEEPVVSKDWETQLQGDTWYLIDTIGESQYSIQEIFDVGKENGAMYEEALKTIKSQKTIVVILVILVILLAAGVTFLIFKIKDMMDSQYFSEVEKETIRKRVDRPQVGQKVMHTVGSKPAGAMSKPAAAARPAPGQGHPGGQRPGAPGQSVRPGTPAQNPGNRPGGVMGQSQRAAAPGQNLQSRQGGAPAQGTRPVSGQNAGGQGAPVQGQRAAAPGQDQGHRPSGAPGQGGRAAQGQNVQGRAAGAPVKNQPKPAQQNPGWKSKNFMSDDDEFEFEFLNWDGDEE